MIVVFEKENERVPRMTYYTAHLVFKQTADGRLKVIKDRLTGQHGTFTPSEVISLIQKGLG